MQNYWETYAPVVNWASVCILLAVAKIHGLSSKSIDFVLAFPQADLEVPVFMELPLGIRCSGQPKSKALCLTVEQESLWLKTGRVQLVCKVEQWSRGPWFCS